MNSLSLIRSFFNPSPERIIKQLDSKGTDLSKAQLEKIVDILSKVKITPENTERKAVIASILRRVESRLDHLQKKEAIEIHTTAAKIKILRENWAINNPVVDKTALREKLKRAVEKAKIIGKGSTVEGAKIMNPTYWLEAFTFKLDGEDVKLYGPTLYPHFLEWKSSADTSKDFQTAMQEKIDRMAPLEREGLRRSILHVLNDKELQEHKAEFKDGKIHSGGRALTDGTYIFVVDPDKENLYVGKKETGHFQHSSFLKGGAVGSAGMIDVKDGKIVSIRNHSGHYLPPSEMMGTAVELIKKESGQLKKDIKVTTLSNRSLKLQAKFIKIMTRTGLKKV